MSKLEDYKHELEDNLKKYFQEREQNYPMLASQLFASVKYSVFGEGKRFRPILSALTAEMLGIPWARVIPWAAAIELVHTYSLIHDDLPCMDNDAIRRGKPTNHIVYGEATALLAGDALLTEAFRIIPVSYAAEPSVAVQLCRLLSEVSGLRGMVAGQLIDIEAEKLVDLPIEKLIEMHELKTGGLIRASVEGTGIIAGINEKDKSALIEFGRNIGIAFQLADDISDYNPAQAEKSGFPKLIGIEATRKLLDEYATTADRALDVFGERAQDLIKMVPR